MSDIILYGRGKTGHSLQKLVPKLGFNPVFYDDAIGFDSGGKFVKDGLVILSPGVKSSAKGVVEAKSAGARVVGELQFCFPLCKAKCVSVTGTNGKTTTCQMITHILQNQKLSVRLLGNGGVPFSEEVLQTTKDETVVLESSSFQLVDAISFSPYISVCTNIAPDHLDYHQNYQNYVAAKCNNFLHQRMSNYAIFNADDGESLRVSAASRTHTLYYSVNNSLANCFAKNDEVVVHIGRKEVVAKCPDLMLLKRHNLSNALCAILVCYLLGVSIEDACDALLTYKFLPHRLQEIAEFSGVKFVDDSKATNVHATLSALSCFNEPLALILGGSNKNGDFDELFLKMPQTVKFVVAVGETAEAIRLAGNNYSVHVQVCKNYKQALSLCYNAVKISGGVVLMSNACASFDLFKGYDERGEHFAALVEELQREESKV